MMFFLFVRCRKKIEMDLNDNRNQNNPSSHPQTPVTEMNDEFRTEPSFKLALKTAEHNWSKEFIEFVLANQQVFWDWAYITSNPRVTRQLIEEYNEQEYSDCRWNWRRITENPNILFDDLLEGMTDANSGLWWSISENSNLTLDVIERNIDKPWVWMVISKNANLTWDFVQAHSEKSWDWTALSAHKCVTWEIIQSNLDKPWRWAFVCRNPNITLEHILEMPSVDWYQAALNPNITLEIFQSNAARFERCYCHFSKNPNLTWDFVKANPYRNWDWSALSKHPNVTWEIIRNNLEKPWDWTCISGNPNITLDIVRANMEMPWYWTAIGRNPMDADKMDFIRKELRQWFSTSPIKEEMMAKVWHPRNFAKFKYLDPETFGEEQHDDDAVEEEESTF
jgi:hypothetical protein